MSVKDLKEAMEKGKVIFGLRETLKSSKGKKKLRVFMVSDARAETEKKLTDGKVDFEKLKAKSEIAKELGLDFECEVFSIK